jgi:hypothetical protein
MDNPVSKVRKVLKIAQEPISLETHLRLLLTSCRFSSMTCRFFSRSAVHAGEATPASSARER